MRADDSYIETVLGIVEAIPRGRATTYGAIAELVGSGPRLVGMVLSRHGGPVPWWRVVRADGTLPPSHQDEGRAHYLAEGTALRRSGTTIDLGTAFWQPVDPARLLAAYDRQLRGEAEVAISPCWDTAGPLWRAVYGDQGLVTYEDLSGYDLAALVAETVAYFSAIPRLHSFEWKTRGHDDLAGLHDVLLAAGFVPGEVETVMVGEAAALAGDPAGSSLPAGVVVRRVDEDPDRERLLAATSALQDEV
ncbi:MAG: MGMT family protein, partial [Nocardioides sp.]